MGVMFGFGPVEGKFPGNPRTSTTTRRFDAVAESVTATWSSGFRRQRIWSF